MSVGARWVAAKGRRRQQQRVSAVGGGDDEDALSSSSSTTATTATTTNTERPAGAEVDLGAVIGRFKEATTSPTLVCPHHRRLNPPLLISPVYSSLSPTDTRPSSYRARVHHRTAPSSRTRESRERDECG